MHAAISPPALACAFVAFAVTLVFYDGLNFVQPVLTFVILLGVAGWLLADAAQAAKLLESAPQLPASVGTPSADHGSLSTT